MIKRLIDASPFGILHPKYFGTSSNPQINLHKKIFWFTLRRQSLSWTIYNLYSWISWYLLFAWFRSIKVWNRKKNSINHISKANQLKSLLYISFVHGIRPISYYQYQLFKYPKQQWSDFIFQQELPHLHRMYSPNITKNTRKLLQDKDYFASEIRLAGLPSINGKKISKGTLLNEKTLFTNQSLFIKPVSGSGQKDNFTLQYSHKNDTYTLMNRHGLSINNKAEILQLLNDLLRDNDFLIQKLLENHELTQSLTSSPDLITIRLITFHRQEKISVASALIEIPLKPNSTYYCVQSIDINSGVIEINQENELDKIQESINIDILKDFQLPFWREICEHCINAHNKVKDVYSVGWDIAITADGVKLLEGNFNWNVVPHQLNGPGLIDRFYDNPRKS